MISVRYDNANLHFANHVRRTLIIFWYNYFKKKKLDQLGCPSLWMAHDLQNKKHQRIYSRRLKSLQDDPFFTDYGMLFYFIILPVAGKSARSNKDGRFTWVKLGNFLFILLFTFRILFLKFFFQGLTSFFEKKNSCHNCGRLLCRLNKGSMRYKNVRYFGYNWRSLVFHC